MKVFFDTNVLVSAFTTRGLSSDVVRLVLAEHELLTGEVNLVELRRTLRSRMRLPDALVESIDELLRQQTVIPRPAEPALFAIRGPDDRWVLASAIQGGADVLVTGDRDLLTFASRAPLPILDPRSFWALIRGTNPR